ncbi:hypothetical protein SDC9_179232 [bioreactor metagenome]|uniref:DUF4143 domain-containing protein n=1 Tax=bioreactor metagenome TaxID=1076179 RepID=A0A645GYE1_9ZZZZ
MEIDSIVQQSGGAWAAFEVKLGVGMHDDAARNLLKFNSVIDVSKSSKPASLNIITGSGVSYKRPDGVNVISVASLGR